MRNHVLTKDGRKSAHSHSCPGAQFELHDENTFFLGPLGLDSRVLKFKMLGRRISAAELEGSFCSSTLGVFKGRVSKAAQ